MSKLIECKYDNDNGVLIVSDIRTYMATRFECFVSFSSYEKKSLMYLNTNKITFHFNNMFDKVVYKWST